jgi:hypothetical protein
MIDWCTSGLVCACDSHSHTECQSPDEVADPSLSAQVQASRCVLRLEMLPSSCVKLGSSLFSLVGLKVVPKSPREMSAPGVVRGEALGSSVRPRPLQHL